MLSFEESNGKTPDGNAEWPSPENDGPSSSILIPVHNRLDLTKACLESVFETAEKSTSFEIIVIDDHSTDGTAEYLQALGPRVRTISNDTRKCFAENINSAAPLARGEYLCFLNNDTLVTTGWLQKLLAAARSDPAIAVVGNRHLTPGTELIDHAGMVFDSRKRPVHLYRGQPADFRPALFSQEFQCVTAACWLVKKKIFLELGGFDSGFKNGFEDIDFCLRAGRAGHKIFYAADSIIYHYGQSTPGRKDHETNNSRYFEKKWGDSIAPDLHLYYALPPPAYDVHWSERFARLEDLEYRRPIAASLIKTVIRAATGLAKRL
jgi:GT2 family glycosyltransferase